MIEKNTTSSQQPQKAPTLKTLTGVVERITFQAADTGYTVARLLPVYPSPQTQPSGSSQRGLVKQAKGDDNLVTIVGTLTGVAVGEALELSGIWQQHSQHGWQFKVENYRSILPATTQGIRKYLGSRLIKGIGPKTAEKIVAHFDVETLDVLEAGPERLNEVPKLGKHKARLIAAAWVEQKAIKEVMVFLQGQGVSTSLAVRIYKQYKDAAITIVKNEPYRLAREVWGIGFKTADKIAHALGFTQDDPERIKAGTLFVLGEASDSGGHTYLPRPLLATKAAELLGVSETQVDTAITGLVLDGGAKVETLAADPQDDSLSFEPLVAVTFVGSAQSAGVSQTKSQSQSHHAINGKPGEKLAALPAMKSPSHLRPDLESQASINKEGAAEPEPGGLMADLDEAIRYSPNYKRIATTTPSLPSSYQEKGKMPERSGSVGSEKNRVEQRKVRVVHINLYLHNHTIKKKK